MRLANGLALVALLLAACATAGDRHRPSEPFAPLAGPPSAPAPEPAPPGLETGEPSSTAPLAPPSDADRAGPAPSPAEEELAARLVARAATMLGRRKGFTAGGEWFRADCSGFVAWAYQAEGIPLRRLLPRVAPNESSSVAAIYQAALAWGVVFGGGGEWPHPGDLVFFRDTYDRNRDGRFDDPFTHIGIVERVEEDGTVVFLHRGSRGVARGAMSLARPSDRRDESGRELNSILRMGRRPKDGSTLAGRLFMGYARLDPARLPTEFVALR